MTRLNVPYVKKIVLYKGTKVTFLRRNFGKEPLNLRRRILRHLV
jgi:hypothetical protein